MRQLKQEYTRGLAFFELVCKKIGINPKARGNLKRLLKNTPSGKRKDPDTNDPYIFRYVDLYNTLQTNKSAKVYLKQHHIRNWTTIIEHFGPKNTY